MGFLMSKPIVIQPAVHDKPNKRAECDKAKTASPQSNNSLAKDIPADNSSKEELAKDNPNDATNVRMRSYQMMTLLQTLVHNCCLNSGPKYFPPCQQKICFHSGMQLYSEPGLSGSL